MRIKNKSLIILNVLAVVIIYLVFVPVDSNPQAKEEGEISLKISCDAVTGPCIHVESGQKELAEAAKEYGDLDCNWLSIQGDLPYNHVADPASIGKCTIMGKVIGVGEEKTPLFKVTHYKISNFNQDDYLLESMIAIAFLVVIAIFELAYFGKIVIKKIQ